MGMKTKILKENYENEFEEQVNNCKDILNNPDLQEFQLFYRIDTQKEFRNPETNNVGFIGFIHWKQTLANFIKIFERVCKNNNQVLDK